MKVYIPAVLFATLLVSGSAIAEESKENGYMGDKIDRCLVIEKNKSIEIYSGYKLSSVTGKVITVAVGSDDSYLYFIRDYRDDSRDSKSESLLRVETPHGFVYQVPNEKLLRILDDGIGKNSRLFDHNVRCRDLLLPYFGAGIAAAALLDGGDDRDIIIPPIASPSQ